MELRSANPHLAPCQPHVGVAGHTTDRCIIIPYPCSSRGLHHVSLRIRERLGYIAEELKGYDIIGLQEVCPFFLYSTCQHGNNSQLVYDQQDLIGVSRREPHINHSYEKITVLMYV